MKRRPLSGGVFLLSVLLALGAGRGGAQTFQGRVFEGASGVETTPISGVTVTLYGSNNANDIGTAVTSATTDANGWYQLKETGSTREYYNIVETNPSGYNSTGAKSQSGTVINYDRIQFSGSLVRLVLSGNKFYDQKQQSTPSNNPPVAEAGGPYSCYAGGSITFDGSASYDPDTGDSITKYEWDLDNDGQYDDATGKTVTKTYGSAGSGTVGLRVTDSHGAQDTDTATYTVSDQQQQERDGAIYGMKFNDLNGNHQKDSGEPGLAGWTIGFTENVVAGAPLYGIATTGSDGKYSFSSVPPGNYTVSEVAQSGWTQTYPTGGSYTVNVAAGQAISNLDFGNTRTSSDTTTIILPPHWHADAIDYGDAPNPYPAAGDSLGGPWLGGSSDSPDAESGMQRDAKALGDDKDGNDDENGITFWPISTSTTFWGAVWGVAEFSISLPPAHNQAVSFSIWIDFNQDGDWDDPGEMVAYRTWNPGSIPSGITPVPFIVPTGAATGTTFARVRVCNAKNSLPLPSGIYGTGEVEDLEVQIMSSGTPPPPGAMIPAFKFNDLDGNGLKDPGEPGLADWTIWLDANGNGILDTGEPTAVTDATGICWFKGLADGSYAPYETAKPGWVQTYPYYPPGKKIKILPLDIKNGQPDPMTFIVPMFLNHQTNLPGRPQSGGPGAVKWIQPPLFNPEQFEEKCFYGWGEPSIDGAVTLADDWFCYNPRPVTSVTWWGTYAGWDSAAPPPGGPQRFHIGVWTHTPKQTDEDWCRPERMIREWFVDRSQLGEQAERDHRMPEWNDNSPEPCFRYTYSIPEPEWFRQEGDSTEFWLSIAAVYTEPPGGPIWGWLTREHYFNANAVRIFAPASARPDSLFRIGEPIQPQNWDMAFILGTDQNTALYDFGDAQDGYGTSFSRNAALHLIRHDVRLGGAVDTEDDGSPDPEALSDDRNGSDDEDGVSFLDDLVPGRMAKAAVTASARGYLSAWLDVDNNGRWDARDRVIYNMELNAGNQMLEFPVADDAVPGKSAMRFRFSTLLDVWVKGFAPDGEIEDYQVDIQQASTAVDDRKAGAEPSEFKLYPNYPNPFNPSTTIRFDLPQAAHVRLSVYNLMGQEIAVLAEGQRREGMHEVRWDAQDFRHMPVPSGVYLYRLEAASFRATGKLLLMK